LAPWLCILLAYTNVNPAGVPQEIPSHEMEQLNIVSCLRRWFVLRHYDIVSDHDLKMSATHNHEKNFEIKESAKS
jgi:hypothetical protein